MEQYYITSQQCLNPNEKCLIRFLGGTKVVFPGFEEFEFFAHRPFQDDLIFGEYRISEKRTGSCIGSGDTYFECYENAFSTLMAKGVNKTREQITKRLNQMNRKTKSQVCNATDDATSTTV